MAPKKRAAARKPAPRTAAARSGKSTKTSSKKPIEQYEHTDKQRLNNPPVGLVKPDTDPEESRKTWAYDPRTILQSVRKTSCPAEPEQLSLFARSVSVSSVARVFIGELVKWKR